MSSADPSPRSGRSTVGTLLLVGLLVAVVALGAWWVRHSSDDEAPDARPSPTATTTTAPGPAEQASPAETLEPERTRAPARPVDRQVVVVSVDGLGSAWVSPGTTPGISALIRDGAGTRNARTAYEQTVTLPNHTGMVTGRRIDAEAGGHGVTWNTTTSRTVRDGVDSVFTTITDAGGTSVVFAGKDKFEMWGRTWPGTIEPLVIDSDQDDLVAAAVASFDEGHDLTFLHLAGPDAAGHASGWGGAAYLAAVREADADVVRVVDAIRADPDLRRGTVLVLTADHGGTPGTTQHGAAATASNYTIPFVVWGRGIARGDLYALNPDYADPGTGRPTYDGPQPVRNADVANVVTDLLELPAVPGSELDVAHDLTLVDR